MAIEQQIVNADLRPGDKVLVAVSGGVDSVVLLHLLHAVADRFSLQLHVAHLDHQIRPESSADAEFVCGLCLQLKIPFVLKVCDVQALATAEKLSLEMAGRQVRQEFLQQVADDVGARLITLAHHRDDQVETFLLRLLRGSGVTGLSAMQPLQGRWWRPLLASSREQVLAYAEGRGLAWVEDASNADPAYLRNRLRCQILPELRDVNPQFDVRVAELCCQLQVDERYWRQQVKETFPEVLVSAQDGLRLDRQKLISLPAALQIRVIREALLQVRGDLQHLEAVHLHAVADLLDSARSQAQLDLPGCWVARRYETLWLRQKAPELLPDYALTLPIPGELRLPCGRVLRVQVASVPAGESGLAVEFAAAEVGDLLQVRNWQPGDRFEPQGLSGSKKLKRLFGDEKLELEERQRVPILISAEQILWVVGLRRSRHAPVTEKSTEILRIELCEGR